MERLPALISREGPERLLGIPKLLTGTGEENVYTVINRSGITDSVIADCCDTTASNTGRSKGAHVSY